MLKDWLNDLKLRRELNKRKKEIAEQNKAKVIVLHIIPAILANMPFLISARTLRGLAEDRFKKLKQDGLIDELNEINYERLKELYVNK